MKLFPVREIARAWDQKWGGTDGCEEKAYLAGAQAALEFAMRMCGTGSTPAMIRYQLEKKITEIKEDK